MRSSTRIEEDFNDNWLFNLTEEEKACSSDYDDSSWQRVSVPHDWSMEQGYDPLNGDGATGYVLGGTGWYRKRFRMEVKDGQACYIVFDGVYNNSEIWINGHKIGTHPYGYSPFYFEISSYLNRETMENLIALKVDRRRYIDSRWYTGSGIYRPVRLIITSPLHVPVWGSFIYCNPVYADSALVLARHTILNKGNERSRYRFVIEILSPEKEVIHKEENTEVLEPGARREVETEHPVLKPSIWDIDTPDLHTARFSIYKDKELTDRVETSFGIRDIRFDTEKGFFLNGRNMKIKGICLHHDAGLAGAAVPRDVWRRRLVKLKTMGCNAIRMAHNPGSEEFLDLCDEIGFLVQDEFFDEWDYPKDKRLNMGEQHDDFISRGYSEHFHKNAEKDLKDTIKCHRNHPSIFQWSIGNEIEWTYPRNLEATGFFDTNANGNYFWNLPPNSREEVRRNLETLPEEEYDIGETAKRLAGWTRETDPTRPVIANCILPSVSFESGYTDALDMVGFSYRRVIYDYARKHYPRKIIMGTENLGQWHEWKAVEERDFVAGTFIWTGIDYLGEAHNKEGKKGTDSGFLDLAGFEKPSYHMYKSLWCDTPHVHLVTQTEERSPFKAAGDTVREKEPGAWKTRLWTWHDVNEHWNYSPGELIIVEAYSNCPEVELFLNGKSLGVKFLTDFKDHIYKWILPFQPGRLLARGRHEKGKAEDSIVTAGKTEKVELLCDRASLKANRRDCAHVTARLLDTEGNPVTYQESSIEFKVSGPVRTIGHDNGSITNLKNHSCPRIETHRGKALMVFQSGKNQGVVEIKISGKNLTGDMIKIPVE